jgi:MFS family permease
LGDILGVAVFAVLLGLARILYARFGKKISPVLLVGMVMCTLCYFVVGLSSSAVLSFIACILVGFFSAMLWPGTLILMEDNIGSPGVTAYALLAAGGDLGASVAPQLVGIVTDTVVASDLATNLAPTLGITTEQLGMRTGMLLNAIFPLLGIAILLITFRYFRKHKDL